MHRDNHRALSLLTSQFAQRGRQLLLAGHVVVPLYPVGHERYRMPFMGVGNDAGWLPGLQWNSTQHIEEVRMLVTINFLDRPAESLPLRSERLKAAGVLRGVSLLQAVTVHDQSKVIKAAVSRHHGR